MVLRDGAVAAAAVGAGVGVAVHRGLGAAAAAGVALKFGGADIFFAGAVVFVRFLYPVILFSLHNPRDPVNMSES